ncbi:MAG: DUF2812 domain-containing protein [Oscillospiraceae bacterium]|nr:DUF2812 domain-containing protein [Oscillospiraceae bacterium]
MNKAKKTTYKLFWLWDFEKEEAWLNEMADRGWALVDVGFTKYVFEESAPGEFNVRLEMLEKHVDHPESQAYIRFLGESGVEYVATLFRWVYFRKKAGATPFDLFSDIDSRVRHLKRILFLPGILGALNTLNAVNMSHRYAVSGDAAYLLISILVSAASLLALYGFIRLSQKMRRLQRERRLRE